MTNLGFPGRPSKSGLSPEIMVTARQLCRNVAYPDPSKSCKDRYRGLSSPPFERHSTWRSLGMLHPRAKARQDDSDGDVGACGDHHAATREMVGLRTATRHEMRDLGSDTTMIASVLCTARFIRQDFKVRRVHLRCTCNRRSAQEEISFQHRSIGREGEKIKERVRAN